MLDEFIRRLSPELRETFLSLNSPAEIQAYLDSIAYVGEDLNRTPERLMTDRQGHCLDGGLFAALALRRIGYPAMMIDLTPEPHMDDDHVLALFRMDGLWGAVAKSNYAGLRYREPIHRSLRELAMTYFEDFYNLNGLKSLRGYTRPFPLERYDPWDWAWSQNGLDRLVEKFYRMKSIPLLSARAVAQLQPMDKRSYDAGMLGTNIDGVYKPK